eukprot:6204641-Pleurochrysis_carterae.AAC.5
MSARLCWSECKALGDGLPKEKQLRLQRMLDEPEGMLLAHAHGSCTQVMSVASSIGRYDDTELNQLTQDASKRHCARSTRPNPSASA